VGFVVDKVTDTATDFCPSIPFSPSIIPPVLHTHPFMAPTLYISNWQRREVREFVGAFAKCLSISLSVHMEYLGSQWTDFHEI
jgi:hypothetical protein